MRPLCVALVPFVCALSVASPHAASAGRAEPPPDEAPRLDAPKRRIALGVSIWDGRRIEHLDAFRDAIGGRPPATWSIWSQWGDPRTRGFPARAAAAARDRGVVPLIWWEPIDPTNHGNERYVRLANVSAGLHDRYIRRFARDARDFGSPLILRFAHEANGRTFPWGAGFFDNSATTFVAAWRHVHRLFQKVGASNVRFLWSVTKISCRGTCNPYARFYPGDAFVDYMGFSSFNWASHRQRWVSMLKGFRRVTKHLSRISRKPIIVVETGSGAQGGDKAEWIRHGYRAVHARLPRIVAIVYLNVDLRAIGHPDWRLASPPEALAAYAEIASKRRFQGRIPRT